MGGAFALVQEHSDKQWDTYNTACNDTTLQYSEAAGFLLWCLRRNCAECGTTFRVAHLPREDAALRKQVFRAKSRNAFGVTLSGP